MGEGTTRRELITQLRHLLEVCEATEHLLERVMDLWETIDVLKERFDEEQVRRIIEAPAFSAREFSLHSL